MIQRANRIIAAFAFLFSFLLYMASMAPTTSFWDCGEFIATAYTMGVPHPPGSPLYLLVGRISTLLPFFSDVGARMNLLSPLASALAVMFLYLIIVQLIRKWRGPVETTTDALIAYGSGIIGAFTFMVTDSHWFNAVEAEVYAASTFLTALTVWLILRWSEKDDRESHVYNILMLAYVIGLATGVHILNLLALPFIALVIYFRRWTFSWTGLFITVAITLGAYLIIHLGIMNGIPQVALAAGLPAAVVMIIAFFIATLWTVRKKMNNTSVIMVSLLLIMVGYSTYATIFIRSQHDPSIDENDPETVRQAVAYLEREQYGDRPLLKGHTFNNQTGWFTEQEVLLPRRYSMQSDHLASYRRYSSDSQFFWQYQVKKMYLRYFLWQFAGRGPLAAKGVSAFGANSTEDGVAWLQFGLPIALILGFIGLGYQMQKDWKHGLAVLALFLATGLMIILYLNQPDPQPRERDYSYVGSFFAWSIWIGIGAGGILELLSKQIKESSLLRIALPGTIGLLLLIMPGVMLFANYHQHDRSGNYVAWDYSYNLLNSCKENGILFTNGDNDTFPLWYLQEVEGVRKDVRVVNLSLLNTDWYISQLRDVEPKLPLSLSDQSIKRMSPIPWKEQTLQIKADLPDHPTGSIEWKMKPTYGGRYIRVQDRMIVQIINDVNWTQPIYFAVTVAPDNKIGLDRFLEMQGLAYELVPIPGKQSFSFNMAQLRHNLLSVYRYTNLGDPSVYYNSNIQRLMGNLRASFLQLAADGLRLNDEDATMAILDTLAVLIPETTIPIRSKELYFQMAQMYGVAGDTTNMRERLDLYPQRFRLTPRDQLYLGLVYSRDLNDWATANSIFQDTYSQHAQNGEVVGGLVDIYRSTGHEDLAINILNDWLLMNPQDQGARGVLEQIQQQ
ncbi:protein O-mannosyl-transferase family [Candidatus Neomarinimicrobiota bacterium]